MQDDPEMYGNKCNKVRLLDSFTGFIHYLSGKFPKLSQLIHNVVSTFISAIIIFDASILLFLCCLNVLVISFSLGVDRFGGLRVYFVVSCASGWSLVCGEVNC